MNHKLLAQLLPGSWKFIPDSQCAREGIFQRSDGAEFWISQPGTYGAMTGKVSIHNRGIYDSKRQPVTAYAKLTPDSRTTDAVKCESISFSADKSEEKIAADIIRRFLPSFDRWFTLTMERLAQENKEHAAKLQTLQDITNALGRVTLPMVYNGNDEKREPRYKFSTGETYDAEGQLPLVHNLDFYVSSSDCIEVNIGYCDKATALKVIELFKEAAKK